VYENFRTDAFFKLTWVLVNEQIKLIVEQKLEIVRFLVLDFSLISGVDYSAMVYSFLFKILSI
jgi:hypothetical protein